MTVEPYIELIRNRNQRQYLSRFRVGSHNLRVESGRWTFPKTKLEDRKCLYCQSGQIDTEQHFITECSLTQNSRNCFYNILGDRDKNFVSLDNLGKLKYILCPVDSVHAKLSNKYLGLLVKTRDYHDQGKPISSVETISLSDTGIQLIYNS